jgi:hypothetical protein
MHTAASADQSKKRKFKLVHRSTGAVRGSHDSAQDAVAHHNSLSPDVKSQHKVVITREGKDYELGVDVMIDEFIKPSIFDGVPASVVDTVRGMLEGRVKQQQMDRDELTDAQFEKKYGTTKGLPKKAKKGLSDTDKNNLEQEKQHWQAHQSEEVQTEGHVEDSDFSDREKFENQRKARVAQWKKGGMKKAKGDKKDEGSKKDVKEESKVPVGAMGYKVKKFVHPDMVDPAPVKAIPPSAASEKRGFTLRKRSTKEETEVTGESYRTRSADSKVVLHLGTSSGKPFWKKERARYIKVGENPVGDKSKKQLPSSIGEPTKTTTPGQDLPSSISEPGKSPKRSTVRETVEYAVKHAVALQEALSSEEQEMIDSFFGELFEGIEKEPYWKTWTYLHHRMGKKYKALDPTLQPHVNALHKRLAAASKEKEALERNPARIKECFDMVDESYATGDEESDDAYDKRMRIKKQAGIDREKVAQEKSKPGARYHRADPADRLANRKPGAFKDKLAMKKWHNMKFGPKINKAMEIHPKFNKEETVNEMEFGLDVTKTARHAKHNLNKVINKVIKKSPVLSKQKSDLGRSGKTQ